MVSEVDFHIGHILCCLDAVVLREETVVVFTSDHGDWLGEHLRYGKGYPGHECVSRVPLLVRWPKRVTSQGQTISSIVEAVDVVPTMLGLVGIPVPPQIQGTSLLPIIDGEAVAVRDSALTEMTGWRTLRTEQFRHVAEADGVESLFDLRQDAHAYHDVRGDPDYTPAMAELRHEMIRRLIDRERPIPRAWAY